MRTDWTPASLSALSAWDPSSNTCQSVPTEECGNLATAKLVRTGSGSEALGRQLLNLPAVAIASFKPTGVVELPRLSNAKTSTPYNQDLFHIHWVSSSSDDSTLNVRFRIGSFLTTYFLGITL